VSAVDIADAGPEPNAPARGSMRYRGTQYRFPGRYRVILVATAVLVAVSALLEPSTLGATSLKIETPLVAVLALASLGQLLVIIVGGFDLSVAAVMTFSGALLLRVSEGADDRWVIAVLVTLLATTAIGAVNGTLASAGLNPLIVTLAMGGVVTAITLLLTGGGTDLVSYQAPPALADIAGKYVANVSTLAFFAIAIVVVQALLLRNTRPGRRFIAAGANPVAASIVGIRVRRYVIAGYALAGMLYGLAGLSLSAFVRNPDLALGSPYLLSTFIVVALGGALFAGGPASVLCTAAGAFFLVLLNQFLAIKGLAAGDQSLIQGIVLIVAVALVTAVRGGALRVHALGHPVRGLLSSRDRSRPAAGSR